PVGDVGETKSMAKEVVLGGDVWDLLDELMIYMKNPMQFFERDVKFVRGVLLSGPPGTGKTLFARTLANQSGLPFVFASGAEFTDSEKSGAARINEMFSLARRNAPCFIFVDEIDAIAGRHTRKDPRRRSTFEALISQLDGDNGDSFPFSALLQFSGVFSVPSATGKIFRQESPGLPYPYPKVSGSEARSIACMHIVKLLHFQLTMIENATKS
ncbi:ATP-dependent zinc metalloprotease FTSH 12 chloroplastic-like, partial [Trifolium medium]|nr:ATP-dependent zinc metalloprotease FTSH 12 chloroplastic-like [Trifolium medium]